MLVGRDEVELVAQARRPSDVGRSAVERNDHREVEGHLATVVAGEASARSVDFAGVELGHELDILLGQHPASRAEATGLVNAPSSGVT